MAWAPLARNTRSTPAMSAATSLRGDTRPSAEAGLATYTCSTPATRAGITVISTDEG